MTRLTLICLAVSATQAEDTIDTLKGAFRQRANEDVLTRLIDYRKALPNNSSFEVDYMIAKELTDLRFAAACEFTGSLATAYQPPRLFDNQEAPLEPLRRRACAGVTTTFSRRIPPPPPPTPSDLLKRAQDELGQRCKQGFVWREAFPGDRACVTPETRSQAAADNASAGRRRAPNGFCLTGYVWREANPDDHVCVTPAVRQATREDNANARRRTVGATSPAATALVRSPVSAAGAVRMAPAPAPAPAVRPQQIMISRVEPGLREVTIFFSTTQATDPWVEISKRPPDANLTFNARDLRTVRAVSGTNHRVRIDGLLPGEYSFVVAARGADGKVVRVAGRFHTASIL